MIDLERKLAIYERCLRKYEEEGNEEMAARERRLIQRLKDEAQPKGKTK